MEMDHYAETIESIRPTEYPQLQTTTYLDHAGTTLYAQSLVNAWSEDLKTHLFGNPHSASPSSSLSTLRVDRGRKLVLNYFNADPSEFEVVFTANATAAIHLVASCFQEQGFWYGYHKDAHTSLVGVRELASQGSRCFNCNADFETWINTFDTEEQGHLRLIAFPAQSNLTGARLPLKWCSDIRQRQTLPSRSVYTLLDAASFLTTGVLDFAEAKTAPDFTALSFYKIFGLPNLGALIVRKEAGHVLTRRRYFGGGTVDMVIAVNDSWHAMHQGTLSEVLEDGTLPFHNIIALEHAITIQQKLYKSPSHISKYVASLAFSLWHELSELRHYNGSSAVQIYREESSRFGDPLTQGPIIAFSLRDSQQSIIAKSQVEGLAIACGIQLRTGGVCNPGGIATMLELEPWELRRNFTYGLRCGNEVDILAGKATGVVRISLGPMTTKSDIDRFLAFIKFFFVEHSPAPSTVDRASKPTPKAESENDAERLYITPIQGCASSIIPLHTFPSSEAARAACAPWHEEWCIFDLDKQVRVTKDFSHLLKVLISHQTGILTVLKSPNSGSPHRENGGSRKMLKINMWNELHHTEQTNAHSVLIDGRPADLYSDTEVRDFLTSSIGSPCTLARFRPSSHEQKLESQRCPVSWCRQTFDHPVKVTSHYSSHAAQFRDCPSGAIDIDDRTVAAMHDRNSKAIHSKLKQQSMNRAGLQNHGRIRSWLGKPQILFRR